MTVIRASVVQACTAAYSLPDTLEKLRRLAKVAKERDNSQLAVFPEALCVTGAVGTFLVLKTQLLV